LNTAHGGRILKEGLRISIAGKPNVGKSSLLNALLGEERAIVTSMPGTTRDTIEEWVNIRNIPLRITDTAGIREASDEVERMGIYRAKETFQKSDLVLLVLDGSQPLSTEDQEIMTLLKNHATLVILNKRDLGEAVNHPQVAEHLPHARILEMSLTEGMGLSQLEETLEDMVYKGQAVAGEELIITQARHEELLGRAKAHLQDGLSAIQRKDALDFVEVDLKNAHQALGDILGITVKDDIIEEVFRRFCLGK
jgi:tRNA modification GTPase